MVQAGKKLLIIAEDVEGDALTTLIVNKLRGTLTSAWPSRRPASATAARRCCRISPSSPAAPSSPPSWAIELKEATVDMLGHARQVKVTKENTIIVDGAGEAEAIKDRVAQIRSQIETTTSDYDREKLQERLAKLAGGVAIIRVGAATETEMKEKKLRIEDALNATRAAVEEGIVAGGGTAYVNAIPAVEKLLKTDGGRREDRRPDRGPGPHRAHAPDRCQRRHRRLRGAGEGQELPARWAMASTPERDLLRHDLRRYRGPHQGHPLRPGERRLRGRAWC